MHQYIWVSGPKLGHIDFVLPACLLFQLDCNGCVWEPTAAQKGKGEQRVGVRCLHWS